MIHRRHLSVSYRRLAIWLMIGCAVFSVVPSSIAFATNNRLSLSSTAINTNTNVGDSFDVKVLSYVDSDQSSAGSVSGSLQYPSNLLKVVSTSSSGTAYTDPGSPTSSVGATSITFSGSRPSSPSGMAPVFTVKFQAIGAGTAIVSFSSDSTVNNAATDRISGVFKLVSQAPPSPSPSPSNNPRPSTSPVPSNNPQPTSIVPTPTPDATAPTDTAETTPDPTGLISDVNISPTYTGGTITWKVNTTHSTSSLAYGSQSSSLDKQGTVKNTADGIYTAAIEGLVPGVRYYFVISGSGDGNKNGTYTGTLITNGFPVEIAVTENTVIATNAQVHIGNINKATGSNGKITLGLAAGTYTGTITTDTASKDITLTVATKTIPTDGSAPESQAFSYDLASSVLKGGPGSGNTILVFVGVLVGSTAILALGFVGFLTYRRNKFDSATSGRRSSSSTTVIIDDGYDWRQDATAGPTSASLPPPDTKSRHGNSVYIDDAEPVDMFDAAKKPPQ